MSSTAAAIIQLSMLVLALLLAAAFAVGTAAFLCPAALERMRRGGDALIARLNTALNTQHNLDRWFYRRHRMYGSAVGLLAIVLLWFLTFGDVGYRWMNAVDPRYRELAALLAQSAQIVLWLFGTFALVIATVVFIRPSGLKGLEVIVNRWISPSRPVRGIEREIQGPDRWVSRHPRTWGALIALMSGTCLLALALHADSLARMGM